MSLPLSPLDQLCLHFDKALKTLCPAPDQKAERTHGAETLPATSLTEAEKKQTAALMRVNHVGEVCAQALYRGQALTARLASVREQMNTASAEEQDHLHWCRERIAELGGKTSLLNPLFYAGAFALGAIAGKIGDKWSLGFVAETEHQVATHLKEHLAKLSPQDQKTKIILEKMLAEETQHAQTALEAGGSELPTLVKTSMRLAAKCMTSTAYYV
jgi:ubiquinone biosynthesis monooxygenase Coq7